MAGASAKRPTSSLSLLREELRVLFRDLHQVPWSGRPSGPPAVDVIETPSGIRVRVDLLAVAPDTLSVEVDGDLLLVKGARRVELEEKAGGARRTNQRMRHFARRIQLPQDLRPVAVDATFEHGLLEITLKLPPNPR